MNQKTLWITRTAAMLALLIALQWVTSYIPKPVQQYVTGSCVNAVLAVTALICGMGSGLTVALLSPVFAYLFGIAPNLVTAPAIMAGNAVFVVLLKLIYGKQLWRQVLSWLAAAAAKFAVLYLLVVVVACGFLADQLIAFGVMKTPMLKMLPATFSWPQLVTALVGGAVALLILPGLKKALKHS